MAKLKISITGNKEIAANLRAIGSRFNLDIAMPAITEAAEVIRDAAITNAITYVDDPTTRSYIPGNIVVKRRIKLSKETGKAIVSIGMRKMKGTDNYTWHWWWLELGSRNTPPKSYLRKAAVENFNLFVATFYSVARDRLIKLGQYPHISLSSTPNSNNVIDEG